MSMPAHAHVRRHVPAAAAALAVLLLCTACSKPEPPETDRPPEPQADASQAPEAADATDVTDADATELRDKIQKPLDRAKAVQGQVDDAAAKERAAVDAQTGY